MRQHKGIKSLPEFILMATMFITSIGWAQQETGTPLQPRQQLQQPKQLQQVPLQFQKSAVILCVQAQMIGNAGKFYVDMKKCGNDIGNLKKSAETMGNNQCKNLCKAVGCPTVKTIPQPLKATHKGCKKRDPTKSTVYGLASTGLIPFDCKCEQ